jgi:gas vesicle protein
MDNKNVLKTVLAGAATGAFIAVLFAPDKGESTRKKIMDKGEGYLSRINQMIKGGVNDLSNSVENAKAEVPGMSSFGKSKV